MRFLCAATALAAFVVLLSCVTETTAHGHHKIARLVVHTAVRKMLKSPVIPLVLPLPIIKQEPRPAVRHEIINVHEQPKVVHKPVFIKEEVHGGWPHGW